MISLHAAATYNEKRFYNSSQHWWEYRWWKPFAQFESRRLHWLKVNWQLLWTHNSLFNHCTLAIRELSRLWFLPPFYGCGKGQFFGWELCMFGTCFGLISYRCTRYMWWLAVIFTCLDKSNVMQRKIGENWKDTSYSEFFKNVFERSFDFCAVDTDFFLFRTFNTEIYFSETSIHLYQRAVA
jgi:hypothetical protein